MTQQIFALSTGFAVCCNPGGRLHGWLLRKHPDGQWVSVEKLIDVASSNAIDATGWAEAAFDSPPEREASSMPGFFKSTLWSRADYE